ncbi:hypothetical protein WMY93_023720 [Mugilogobius chulae]|uniref:Uncharacterized protein n=1 Tax=Mugilogobius chulae TaxID=88201 RepID=A0AAW0NAQ7_9GOBI
MDGCSHRCCSRIQVTPATVLLLSLPLIQAETELFHVLVIIWKVRQSMKVPSNGKNQSAGKPTVTSLKLNWMQTDSGVSFSISRSVWRSCVHIENSAGLRDQWNRTIHDLATDDCKDLLENLNSYRVLVVLPCSAAPCGSALVAGSSPGPDHVELGSSLGPDHVELGSVVIERSTEWSQLRSEVLHMFMAFVRSLCQNPDLDLDRNRDLDRPLGLSHNSIKSIQIGDREWSVGEDVSLCPWDLVRKPPSPNIRLKLRGLSELCLDEVALFSLIPLSTLNNYVRLVEQYGNLMLHGVEGSLQENMAAVVAHCIKISVLNVTYHQVNPRNDSPPHVILIPAGKSRDVWLQTTLTLTHLSLQAEKAKKQEALGLCCEVVRVQVDSSLTREQLLNCFIQAGALAPAGSEGRARVVVTVEHLERALSLCTLMGDICHSLDHRGPQHTLNTS